MNLYKKLTTQSKVTPLRNCSDVLVFELYECGGRLQDLCRTKVVLNFVEPLSPQHELHSDRASNCCKG